MKLTEVMNGINYQNCGGPEDAEISNITIDSRMVKRGSLFVCIKGLKIDRHLYVKDACEQGAAALIVQDDVVCPENVAVVKVADTREAFSYASANFCGNPAKQMDIIGVTGTKGKTSTTYFIESILCEMKRKVGVIGTVETRVNGEKINIPFATATTPDSIELNLILKKMLEEGADSVALEVSSHALELRKVEGIEFKVGIFTNLTHDHLDFHGTMENYMLAKARLFGKCEYGVINIDNEYGEYMKESCSGQYITYSIDKESDLRAFDIKYSIDGVRFKLYINCSNEEFYVPIKGKFSVYNSLGAIGAALWLGIPVETIKTGLANITTVPGRIESIPNNRGFNVIIDYAHTPDSIVNVINTVRDFTTNNVITVFGCGGDKDRLKRPVMGRMAGELSDYCIITSDNPRTEDPVKIVNEVEAGVRETGCKYEKEIDRREAIFKAINLAQPGDSVVIAGKGHENYQIFAECTIHFDDMEVAREALGLDV